LQYLAHRSRVFDAQLPRSVAVEVFDLEHRRRVRGRGELAGVWVALVRLTSHGHRGARKACAGC
jgi:hypothetical protein